MPNNSLEAFKITFIRYCNENNVEPSQSFINKIIIPLSSSNQWGKYTLDLSSTYLSSKISNALSKALKYDSLFSEINLSNCQFNEEGLINLCNALLHNSSCKKLDLKGNAIKGSSLSPLSELLRRNFSIHSLCLGSNGLGLLDSNFAEFCESLKANKSLHVLDLQNNQLTAQGARDLSNALKFNNVLRSLDLSWNHIGLIGGRYLLSMLDDNEVLSRLALNGNDIPNDTLKAIEAKVSKNAMKALLNKSIPRCCEVTHNEKPELKSVRSETSVFLNKKWVTDRMCSLYDALEERKKHVNEVSAQLNRKNSALLLSEDKLNKTTKELKYLKDDFEREMKRLKEESTKYKEECEQRERRLTNEIMQLSEKNHKLNVLLKDYETQKTVSDEKVMLLMDKCAELENKIKNDKMSFEKVTSDKEAMYNVRFKEIDHLKIKEIEVLKKDKDNMEHTLKERINILENERNALNQQLEIHINKIKEIKSNKDQEIERMKSTLKIEETQKIQALERANYETERNRDELRLTLTKVQGEHNNLQVEKNLLQQQIVGLQMEIQNRYREKTEEIKRVKQDGDQRAKDLELELKNRDKKLEVATVTITRLKDKLDSMKQLDIQHSSTLQLVAQNLVAREVTS